MSENKVVYSGKVLRMAQNALIIAIMIIMSITPLGYIKMPTVEITLLPVPIVVGAILLGPASGALFGTVFGITSFLQCIGIPTLSWFGSMLFSINGFYTLILCIIPRILMGYLTGVIFKLLSKIDKTKFVSYVITSISGALMNTVFFITALMLLFGNSEFILGLIEEIGNNNIFLFFVGFVGINGLIEAGVCAFAGVAISKVLSVIINKRNSTKKGLI